MPSPDKNQPITDTLPDIFRPLATYAHVVYFCYRPADGRVLYVSPSYERVLGGTPAAVNEELPGWLARLHPDDRPFLRQRLAHASTGELAEGVKVRLKRPVGGWQWLCLTLVGFRPDGPADDAANPMLISGHVEDITKQHSMLANAIRYQAKKNSMLEILSHDLASPLMLAEQMSDYLTERLEPLQDGELNRLIEGMRTACQEGVELIRTFLDQEFLDSTSVELVFARVDLAERVRIILDNYQQRQRLAGHQFLYEVSHPSIYAEVDENRILLIINNLISNAIKFTPDGGWVRVRLSRHVDHVLLEVSDNGIGIPEELQPVLFDRFTKARRTGLRGEKTTGLGMSIIKSVVSLHHGKIRFESQEGQGTSFFIELPNVPE